MRAAFLLLPLVAAACFQAPSPTQVAGNNGGASKSSSRRGGNGTGGGSASRSTLGSSGGSSGAGSLGASSSGGSSSGAGGSSSGGSTSSSSSAGSSSGAVPDLAYLCTPQAVAQLELGCPNGAALASQVIDGTNCVPIPGAVVVAVGANGVPVQSASAVANSNGAFVFCVPFATPFTVMATAAGYLTTYVAELTLAEDGGGHPPLGQVGMVELSFLGAFGSVVPGGANPTKGFAVAVVSGTDFCNNSNAGWTFALSLPDGGAIQDGGYALLYIDEGELPDPSLTATSSRGVALFLNVAASGYLLVEASNPDAGACPVTNAQLGYTGRVFLGGNLGSYAPFVMP